MDSALSQVGLRQLQVVLSLVSAGHGPPDLRAALLQLLLPTAQSALIWGPRQRQSETRTSPQVDRQNVSRTGAHTVLGVL